ncbi:hypothetical protein NL676_007334 [Syzygium grande]|nr:hypothetical protein NL676_007334 [Syzygium grande]
MAEGSSVNDHALKVIWHIEELTRLNLVMDNELAVDLILQSLPNSFSSFVQNFHMHKMEKTLTELHSMLVVYEKEMHNTRPNVVAMAKASSSKTFVKKLRMEKLEARHASFLENQFVQEGGAGRKIVLQEENNEVSNNQVQTPSSNSVGAYDPQPLRRSARTYRPPARYRHLIEHIESLFIVNDDDQLGDLNPYEEAMLDIDSDAMTWAMPCVGNNLPFEDLVLVFFPLSSLSSSISTSSFSVEHHQNPTMTSVIHLTHNHRGRLILLIFNYEAEAACNHHVCRASFNPSSFSSSSFFPSLSSHPNIRHDDYQCYDTGNFMAAGSYAENRELLLSSLPSNMALNGGFSSGKKAAYSKGTVNPPCFIRYSDIPLYGVKQTSPTLKFHSVGNILMDQDHFDHIWRNLTEVLADVGAQVCGRGQTSRPMLPRKTKRSVYKPSCFIPWDLYPILHSDPGIPPSSPQPPTAATVSDPSAPQPANA